MGAVTVATSIRGWNFRPHEFAKGTGSLIRAKDGASILASTDNRLWEEQIHDFEFIDGEQWTAEQIAAMKPAIDLHRHLTINELPACFSGCACLRCVGVVKPGTQVAVPNQGVHLGADGVCIHGQSVRAADQPGYAGTDLASKTPWMAPAVEVPFIKGGHYDAADSERYGCHLIWWPDELCPPFFEGERGSRTLHMSCPTSGMPTYYDISYDERRPITQAILDKMESGIQRLAAERQEIRAAKDAEIALLRQALAMKDARIGELKSVIASTPVAFEDPDAKPEPVSNPFREFPRDMRRMGP